MARSQELSRLFEHPESTAHRHYEICRAYFLEHLTADELAQRFDLHVGSIRAIVRDFAHDPDLGPFFGPGPTADRPSPKRASIRDRACVLRRQGLTLAEIRTQLHTENQPGSVAYLFRLLQDEGLAVKGQRCRPVRQPGDQANDGSLVPDSADVRQLALTNGRHFTTKVAGLWLFLPQRLALDLPDAVGQAGLPGSEQIPSLQAFLALLLPKLLGHRRISHISDLCADEGAGLWAGRKRAAQDHLCHRLLLPHGPHDARTPRRGRGGQNTVGGSPPELQPRLSRHSVSRSRAGPGKTRSCRCATAP